MKRIKIAFFISNLGQGGAERQMVELLKNINTEKFDVDLILYAYQKESFFKEVFDIKSINIIINKLKKRTSFSKILEALIFIRKSLINKKYDIVFTTLFMNGFLVRLAAPKIYKNKLIASVRTSLKNYNNWQLFAEKKIIYKSYLVFNSRKTLENFKELFPKRFSEKFYLIYNGFAIENDEKFNNYTIINSEIVIGGLGRQNIEKNFSQLVRVYQKLRYEEDYNNTKLILQGSKGNDTEYINKLIANNFSNNIVILKQNTAIENFFSNINILVIPSIFEGCPNVLFEAMIYKTICLISKGANSDNFVVDGVNGFVYDGSDNGLLDSLKRTISIIGTKQEKEIIDNAYCYVKDNFSLKKMVKEYEDFFIKLYNNK